VQQQLMHRLAVVALIKCRKNKIQPMSQSAQHDTTTISPLSRGGTIRAHRDGMRSTQTNGTLTS
jgi:hypothetical protein